MAMMHSDGKKFSLPKIKETELTVWMTPRFLTFRSFYLQIRKINDTTVLKKVNRC